jgi:sugar phosphate isomerase/epimerase
MAFPECLGGEGPVLETLSQIATDTFFSAVEVSWIKDSKVRSQAADLLATSGLEVIFVAPPALMQQDLSLCDLDSAKRKQAVDGARQLIDQAYELGAALMMVMSGPDPGEAARPRAVEALTDSLKQLCQYSQERAEQSMLSISLENFDRDVDKRQLVGPQQLRPHRRPQSPSTAQRAH